MRRHLAAALALAVLGAGLTGTAEGAVDELPPPRTVTLVTGDTLTVTGRQIVFGAGRGRAGYVIREAGGHLTVLPTDALAELGSGRLDRRLFDLTALLAGRQDDAGVSSIPLQVSYRDPSALTALRRLGATATEEGGSGRATVRLTKRAARAAWPLLRSGRSGITGVRLVAAVPSPEPAPMAEPGQPVRLTVRVLDPAGQPTGQYAARLVGLDREHYQELYDADGVVEVTVPAGRYQLDGVVGSGTDDAPHTHLLARPELELSADTTVDLDTRLTRPFRVTVENDSVRPVQAGVGYARRDDSGSWTAIGVEGADPRQLSSAHLGPAVPADQLAAYALSQWAVPGPDGEFRNTPVRYGLQEVRRGRLFTGSDRRVHDRDLARLDSRFNQQAPDRPATRGLAVLLPEQHWAIGYFLRYDLPAGAVEYLEPGPDWSADLWEFQPGGPGFPVGMRYWPYSRTFTAGSRQAEVWNAAVFGPSFPVPWSAVREGDYVGAAIGMYGDQAGHSGESETDSARTSLYRNGVLIASRDQAGQLPRDLTVPPERSRYTLEVKADRGSFSDLSVRMAVRWGFDSAKSAEQSEALPLWALRFRPQVDPRNEVPASAVTTLPFTAEPQLEAKVGALRLPSVELSGDDGTSWHPARVVALGGNRYVAIARTPAGASYISVRAKAADTAGNTVEQEIIRGYALRP